MSVDPLTASYPWYTPYQFAGNKPIWAVDFDGLEDQYYLIEFDNDGNTILKEGWQDFDGVEFCGYECVDGFEGVPVYSHEKWIGYINVIIGDENFQIPHQYDTYEELKQAKPDDYYTGVIILAALKGYEIADEIVDKALVVKSAVKYGVKEFGEEVISSLAKKSDRILRLPKALQRRPKWWKKIKKTVYDRAPKNSKGQYIDEETLKPTDEPVIGLKNETWYEYQENKANWKKTRKEVIKDYNNTDNLQIEDFTNNSRKGGQMNKGKKRKKE